MNAQQYLAGLVAVFKTALAEWRRDNAPRLGAAISYYTLISLAPLLVIAVAIGGSVFGEKAARGEIVTQIGGLVGEQSAQGIQEILEHARQPQKSFWAASLGIVILLVGAAGVFVELKDAFNTIWDVHGEPKTKWKLLMKEYFWSFTMVLGMGFLLLVSLVLSAGLTAMGRFFGNLLPGSLMAFAQWGNAIFSFVLITLLFAVCFKILPDVVLDWRDVWLGAAVTSLLFTAGKFLIGIYLGHSTISSTYGAAGSLVVLLVWIYYSTQILLFGAEFTKCYKRSTDTRQLNPPS